MKGLFCCFFNRSVGTRLSANEHLVPEQLFKTEDNAPKGVSAVKAIKIAMSEGQKIYTLTNANQNQIYNIDIDLDARNEIINALNAGKEVQVHGKPIQAYGFNGFGYIILGQETGAGAYKISGGADGNWMESEGASIMLFISIIALGRAVA